MVLSEKQNKLKYLNLLFFSETPCVCEGAHANKNVLPFPAHTIALSPSSSPYLCTCNFDKPAIFVRCQREVVLCFFICNIGQAET